MQLWEITLPLKDNAGVALHMAHKNFAATLLDTFGGYTDAGDGVGAWRDGGKVYKEPVRTYRVACEDEPAFGDLAGPYFPDQLAFFVAQIGAAKIIDGPAAHA